MINIQDTGLAIDQEVHIYHKGYEDCQAGYAFGPFVRDHYLLHVIQAGQGVFQMGEKSYHLKTNQAFVIFPDAVTYYQADHVNPWSYYWVGFHGLEIEQIFRDAHMSIDHPVIDFSSNPQVLELVTKIYQLKDQEVIYSLKSKGLLYLLLDAMTEGRHEKYKYLPKDISHKEHYVEMAIDYIRRNYTMACKVEDMARSMGIERSHLSRVFRDVIGISLQDYLIRFRIEKAKALLRTRKIAIKAVGYSVGYYDAFYFSKIFKKVVGCTPSEYINNNIT